MQTKIETEYIETRPVRFFPGYKISRDGRIFSTIARANGAPYEMKHKRGRHNGHKFIRLSRTGTVIERKVADLVREAWGTLDYFTEGRLD